MEIDRPLPNPMTPEAKPYWDGLREQKLMLPKCGACGHVFWYPRVACPRCHTRNIGGIQSKGRGTLHAFEIGYQSFKDRKSTRLNSSHLVISYAVFCLKKKNPQVDAYLVDQAACTLSREALQQR